MAVSRRDLLAEVGGIGLGSQCLGTSALNADDSKPQANPTATMIFETVFTEGVAEISYLIGDKATGKAAVIDPRRDIDVYLELARKHKLTIKARPVAVYCDSGYRASLAASLLVRMGFKDVRNVPGSWKAWKAAGYAVQKPKEQKKGTDTDLS